LAILIPSLSFAAYLLNVMHSRELSVLHQSAETRAMLAASFFDDEMSTLLQTLKTLPATPATATENVYDRVRSELDRKGILLFTRSEKLDLLSPASGADAALINLDGVARSAAAAAISTLVPQITPYGAPSDGGVNIWIASASKDAPPTLLQARIPSSFLASAFKKFVSDGPWSISVVGADGQVFAEAAGKSIAASDTKDVSNPSLVEAFADTSQFGWRIAAGISQEPIEIRAQRNWMAFLALSSVLAAASFVGATLLTRNLLEEPNLSNSSQVAGMPFLFNRKGKSTPQPASAENVESRIRSALHAGNVGVWEWDLQTGLVHFDAEIAGALGDLAGTTELAARSLLRHVEPYDHRRILTAVGATITRSEPLAVEVRLRRPDGRWIAVRGAATATKNGAVNGLSGVAYDITDQKLSLTRTDALLREVSHRSKNLLALILAMARLTARDAVDVKSHLKDFTLRVAGLAASQDLIVASDWQSVDFSTLAAAEIGAVARTDADRVVIAGRPVMLTPEAAQTLGMVLTELTLNAVEHGALSSATGEVHLSWAFPGDATISISWHETGGPPFVSDGAKGYGMSVVERFSTQGLKLSARAVGDLDGFTWTLSGPLANIGTRPEKRR
jgi:two-component sensor histidine kinase